MKLNFSKRESILIQCHCQAVCSNSHIPIFGYFLFVLSDKIAFISIICTLHTHIHRERKKKCSKKGYFNQTFLTITLASSLVLYLCPFDIFESVLKSRVNYYIFLLQQSKSQLEMEIIRYSTIDKYGLKMLRFNGL